MRSLLSNRHIEGIRRRELMVEDSEMKMSLKRQRRIESLWDFKRDDHVPTCFVQRSSPAYHFKCQIQMPQYSKRRLILGYLEISNGAESSMDDIGF